MAAGVRCAVTAMVAGFRDTIDESFTGKVRGDADDALGARGAGLGARRSPRPAQRHRPGRSRAPSVVTASPSRRARRTARSTRSRAIASASSAPIDDGDHWVARTLPTPPAPALPLSLDGGRRRRLPRLPARRRRALHRRWRHLGVPEAGGHVRAARARLRQPHLRRARPPAPRERRRARHRAPALERRHRRARGRPARRPLGDHRPWRHAPPAPLRERPHLDDRPRDPRAPPGRRLACAPPPTAPSTRRSARSAPSAPATPAARG